MIVIFFPCISEGSVLSDAFYKQLNVVPGSGLTVAGDLLTERVLVAIPSH